MHYVRLVFVKRLSYFNPQIYGIYNLKEVVKVENFVITMLRGMKTPLSYQGGSMKLFIENLGSCFS